VERIESVFDGFGCSSVAIRDETRAVHLRPAVAKAVDETHAALVLGPRSGPKMDLSCAVLTAAQLREGSPPNPHEVGWLVWHYRDNDHFYYLMVKPNGWELGKRDPGYPGGQRFLATGAQPSAAVGKRTVLKVVQTDNEIEAYVDGVHIATLEDTERPYLGGRIGVYTEDADVYFDSISLDTK
jgi:hypothetical protein